jgi:hypothetical protein
VSEPVYARAPDVVWRLAPDRVLVRRIGAPDLQAQDLHGAAALVWISLDEPGTMSGVTERIIGAGLEVERDDAEVTIRLLLDERIVVADPTDR